MSKQASLAIVRVVAVGILAAVAGPGCDARWHLIGEGFPPKPPAGGTGGQAAMGTGGISGTGGAGTAGAPVVARPLPVPARQVVTRLSRLLWESAPDAALVDTADGGSLATSEDVRQLAVRMLADPRATSGVGSFYRWWLNLDRLAGVDPDRAVFPQFTPELVGDMGKETETFAVSVTLGSPGTLSTLLTAPYSYLNERLAALYGVAGVSGTDLRMTALDPSQRAGLLTQPAILALSGLRSTSDPVHRGLFITQRVRCFQLPPPPPEAIAAIPPPSPPPQTTRQRYEAAIAEPVCISCHVYMERMGFAYEHYDAIGQYRTVDNGLPVDSSAQLPGSSPVAVKDAIDLARALAQDVDTQKCLPRQVLGYALGRPLAAQDDDDAAEAHRWFESSGFVLRDLIAGVAQTDAFLREPPVCTPGADQTCNDDPRLSSIHGQCTAAARCVCPNSVMNTETGRCL